MKILHIPTATTYEWMNSDHEFQRCPEDGWIFFYSDQLDIQSAHLSAHSPMVYLVNSHDTIYVRKYECILVEG